MLEICLKNVRNMLDLYGWNYAARPEGAEALSPGQRPGSFWAQICRPVRAKALKSRQYIKLLPLQGALPIAIIPRAMPWAKSFCPFRACQPYRSKMLEQQMSSILSKKTIVP